MNRRNLLKLAGVLPISFFSNGFAFQKSENYQEHNTDFVLRFSPCVSRPCKGGTLILTTWGEVWKRHKYGIVSGLPSWIFVKDDPFIERHLSRDWEHSIYQMSFKVLTESQKRGEPPAKVATQIADKLSLENHPIFGHRGQEIIDSLVADRWHEKDENQ